MLNLPKSTEFNKRIPKQKFYDNLNVTAAIKQIFVEQIKTIFWKNKISPSTTNLAEEKNVTEIEIFEIKLNTPALDESILKLIDKGISYHILFILNHDDKFQLWIGYKEKLDGTTAFKVGQYYHTEWSKNPEIEIQGLDMDKVYENFIRQIAGDSLSNSGNESLQESVQRQREKENLKKQIDQLTRALHKEKQFNRQIELNQQIKMLKKQLEVMNNGKNENANA